MRLLLHICCAPCAVVPVERLRALGYEVVGYFANPNIQPLKEYLQRRETLTTLAKHIHLPVLWQDDVYSLQGWLSHVHNQGFADNPDNARCTWCTGSRLALTCSAAKAHGFEAFSTSLLYSRYQAHDSIKAQGMELDARTGQMPRFVYEDFRNGWQKGIDISKQYELYRQSYCGCVFSEAERYAKTLQRFIAHPAS